jgi:tripeptide aminopeptidase
MIARNRLLETFLRLVRISSPSGAEAAVAQEIAEDLSALGLSAEQDDAGNLLVRLSGDAREPLLLTAHLDTVRPCEQVVPIVCDGRITSDGRTILGADDKAGVAVILEVLRVLLEDALSHRPVDVLFTVREETGLEGAKACDPAWLRARMGIGLDSGGPQGTIIAAAPYEDVLDARIHGRAAHAGVNPEDGINAIVVAAEAITAMPLGRIDLETTANIGVIAGGLATNIIADLVTMQGEARSHERTKLASQTAAMVGALQQAAERHGATAEICVNRDYDGYRFDNDAPVVQLVSAAMRSLGLEPHLVATGGGSDANILNAAGISTVEISVGMADVHTCQESVVLSEMVSAAQVVLACLR